MTELELLTEQSKRQHLANVAMAHRQWSILDTRGGWKVKTHTDTYTITPLPDGRLACTCPDFKRYGALGMLCKHVCGLLIYLEEGGAPRQLNPNSKGDNRMNPDFLKECAWVKLFHPSSAQVTIPLSLDKPILVAEAQALMASVTGLLQAGFTVDVSGLEEAEHLEEIGFVVRRSKANPDGTETPVVDLYPARGNFRLLGKYLNNEADIQAFEAACGVILNTLPFYEGNNSIERNTDPRMDKYVVALKHPVKVVWKMNPKFEGENDKRNAKRLFVRWDGLPALPTSKPMSLVEARNCICPVGCKSHPEYKGMQLDQVAKIEDGHKVLEYLAGNQYQPNGDKEGHRVKAAAKLLLISLQPA
ncbi:MAG: SWIM zinc finger family protein [Anaerolineales bacterium]|jgi:hypothetical protein